MSRRLTKETFIKRSLEKHGDKFDYSKVEYIDSKTKVCIICKEHGEFWQVPNSHMLSGHGCKKCSDIERGINIRRDFEEYRKELQKIHNDYYDYSKSVYNGTKQLMTITCPIHGDFQQTPGAHKKGKGCDKCGRERKSKKMAHDYIKFIEKTIKIHDNKYEYPDIENTYSGSHIEIPILCKNHGIFFQTPAAHLRGTGCNKCSHSVSKPELEVQDFVKNLGLNIDCNTRRIIKPLELDIFIPSLNKAIEFNGDWWHYDENNPYCRGEEYHENKTRLCKDLGIELLHIRESDWNNNKEKIKSQIKQLVGIQ